VTIKTSCYKVCDRSSCNAPDLSSRDIWFKLWLEHYLSRGIVVFLNRYRQISGYYLKLCHDRFLQRPFLSI